MCATVDSQCFEYLGYIALAKCSFFQEMLIYLSISTNVWTFFFPELKDLNFGEICLEIEDAFKFDSLVVRARRPVSTALKITKIQIFKFRKIKDSCV